MIIETTYGFWAMAVFLCLCAVQDAVFLAVDRRIFGSMFLLEAASLLYLWACGRTDRAQQILTGLLPGILMLGLAMAARGHLGIGDGLYFMIAGAAMGWKAGIWLILGTLLLSCAAGTAMAVFPGAPGSFRSRMSMKIPMLTLALPPGLLLLLNGRGL